MPASSAQLDFDYIIVGGGAAGLSLAYHIAQEPLLADKKVLLVEPEAKEQNDRTWSFWTDEPTPFDGIAVGEWQQIAFRSPGFEQIFDLGRYCYKTIRGLDYYRFVQNAIVARPQQFTILRTTVTNLNHTRRIGVRIKTLLGEFTARYAFDSRPPCIQPQPDKYRYQVQHFVGWEVETETDVFDPEVVEFMDFRGEQQHEARFIYVLPFTRRTALVEYTLFSGTALAKPEYEAAIQQYMSETLGVDNYKITAEEVGAIPMTDHPLPAQTGQHIINIGLPACRC